jgi:hypothetical protein
MSIRGRYGGEAWLRAYAGLTRARETGGTLALMRFVVGRHASAGRPRAESRADRVEQGGMEH